MMNISLRTGITLFFLTVFLGSAIHGWGWPYIAKLMPVYFVAIPGIALCLVELFRDATGSERKNPEGGIEMDEVFKGGLELRQEVVRTLTFFSWFAGGALSVWLLGIVIALPLLALLYSRVEGREKWRVSLILAAGIFAFLWGLFEYALEIRWPPGFLFR